MIFVYFSALPIIVFIYRKDNRMTKVWLSELEIKKKNVVCFKG